MKNRILAAILAALTLLLLGTPVAQAADDPCASQQAALDQVHAQIDAHNAEPHTFIVPDQQAAADAYDAEAAELDAAQTAAMEALQTCQDTLGALADAGPNSAPLKSPSPYMRDLINKLRNQLPSNVRQYTSPDADGYWRIPKGARPLYLKLRQDNPGKSFGAPSLQGQPRPNIGDPDPIHPGQTIIGKTSDPTVPAVTADHIVPIAEIMNMPGFLELDADNMYLVTRAPVNFQWMSQADNLVKSSGSAALIEDADPTWLAQQLTLHDEVKDQLAQIIQKLLAGQQ